MRPARILLVSALPLAMIYATSTMMANASQTPDGDIDASVGATTAASAPPSSPTVEVFSPDGTIARVPVREGYALTPRAEATTPMSKAFSAADGSVTTVVQNGPSDKRFDFVFVGDGYRESEQELFHKHALQQWEAISKKEPFASLKSSFNVWLVDVVSQESGADNIEPGVLRNTALDAEFYCNNIERLLCADQRKASEYAQKAPGMDQVSIIVNTTKYGGAGGFITTVAGGNTSASEVLLHELGHSIGGLADEYAFPGTYTGPEPAEPNVSKLTADAMRSTGSKWAQFLGQSVPGGGTIGTYEGGHHAENGIYRPSEDSIMRTLGGEFDAVGSAAMRAAILAKVS